MKILFIADINSIHTRRWINYFAQNKHSVAIISFSNVNDADGSIEINERINVYELTNKILKQISSNIFLPFRLLVHLYMVKKIIQTFKPDIVHAHFVHYNGWVASLTGFHPLVISGWGSDIHTAPKKFIGYKIATKYAISKADIVTSGSDYITSLMLNLGAGRSNAYTINHGIDLNKMYPRSDKDLKPIKEKLSILDGPVVFSPRLLRPIYNIDSIVRAIPILLKKYPQATFILCETGSSSNYSVMIKNLINKLGVSDNVRFVSNIKHNEMPLYYSLADVSISIPTTDSAGMSILEAMACGSVPVVYDLPAYREYMKRNINGYILSSREPKVLAETIRQALDDDYEKERIRKANFELVKSADYNKSMSQMESLYLTLVGNKTRSL